MFGTVYICMLRYLYSAYFVCMLGWFKTTIWIFLTYANCVDIYFYCMSCMQNCIHLDEFISVKVSLIYRKSTEFISVKDRRSVGSVPTLSFSLNSPKYVWGWIWIQPCFFCLATPNNPIPNPLEWGKSCPSVPTRVATHPPIQTTKPNQRKIDPPVSRPSLSDTYNQSLCFASFLSLLSSSPLICRFLGLHSLPLLFSLSILSIYFSSSTFFSPPSVSRIRTFLLPVLITTLLPVPIYLFSQLASCPSS